MKGTLIAVTADTWLLRVTITRETAVSSRGDNGSLYCVLQQIYELHPLLFQNTNFWFIIVPFAHDF
jgi:hypothetical protein